MLQEMPRDFKGIWIPREIWLHPDLSALEKALWAEIDSLYDPQHGGCYASNEYLQKFTGLKDRQNRDLIYKLKSLGFIEEVSFNGRVRVIKAILPSNCSDWRNTATQTGNDIVETGGKSPPYMAENRHQSNKISNKIKKVSKDTKKEGEGFTARAPSYSSNKVKRALYVYTSAQEHAELQKKYGTELLEEAYDRLSEWKADTPKSKWKKSDSRSIERWVIDAIKEKKNKNGHFQDKELISHKFHEAEQEMGRRGKSHNVIRGPDYIEFVSGPHMQSHIKIDDPQAESKLIHMLRKFE